MTRRLLLVGLIAASAVTVGGCVAAMAASALGAAARSARGQPQSNEHLQPAARKDCALQAAQYGAVHIIDVEQRSIDRIIVWGTVDDGKQRRSFECSYGTKLTGFKLRSINPTG
jgi:hypothetical protein